VSSQLPYPLPGKYDPSGPFRNPGVTNPLPAPGDIPTPCWFGGSVPVSWTNVSAVVPVTGEQPLQLQGFWRSPIFDLRPDIRNVSPNIVSEGAPGRLSALPMWNRAAQLWVQLENPAGGPGGNTGLLTTNLAGFRVMATERVHVSDPNRVEAISAPEDVTAQFVAGAISAVCGWYPFGDGNPARFYQLELEFDMLQNFQNPEPLPPGPGVVNSAPTFTIVPAMY